MLVSQKRNLEQDLIRFHHHHHHHHHHHQITIHVYHISVLMNIIGNSVIMGLVTGSSHEFNNAKHTSR